ncbi:MAG: hypothetical protein Q7S70_01885 [bacterium]|nr:hypothetical protein [bacterium]
MLKIIGMTRDQLLGIHPASLKRPGDGVRLLTELEVVYIAQTLGAFWRYDYVAAKIGRVGLHAELKSGLHSDGFFISRILLESPNIRLIIADQQALRFRQLALPHPDWVAGIPDGATDLGKDVADLFGANLALMKKEDGRISTVSQIPDGETLLLVEDFCTRGTGYIETVLDILAKQPKVRVLPYELVIINRGGLDSIKVSIGNGAEFVAKVVPVVNYRVNDWKPEECPLCKMGSKAIKPKATDENWRLITTSQLEPVNI